MNMRVYTVAYIQNVLLIDAKCTTSRLNGNIDDSPIVLSLLEFVAVFSESHLERCINMCNGFGSATTAPSVYSPSTNMSLSQVRLSTLVSILH
jgi:hypothetical protein